MAQADHWEVTERDIRIEMQPRWKVIQERFILMCGGDMEVMRQREPEREAMEAPLREEYLRRVEALK